MTRITLKSSTVFVSVDHETRVFRTVDEVPPEWRRKFERPKGGLKPRTIWIADRKGREEILRALQGQPSSVQTRWKDPGSKLVAPPTAIVAPAPPPVPVPKAWIPRAIAIEAGLVTMAATVLWWAFAR